jgi:hypothetical protein
MASAGRLKIIRAFGKRRGDKVVADLKVNAGESSKEAT